jgi:phosphate transport system substrate-binding protein
MPSVWRFLRPVLLSALVLSLALPLTPSTSFAQGDEPSQIVIQGSLQLEPLVSAVRDAYVAQNEDADILIDAQGPAQGFEALCAGEADMVVSTGPMTDSQVSACASADQSFVETVLAYEAIVLVADPAATLSCLDLSQVETVFSLGAEPEVLWEDLGSSALTGPVVFYGPDPDSASGLLFASLLPAGDLREGIDASLDPAGILEAVNTPGQKGLGYMSMAEFEAADGSVTPVSISQEGGECVGPTLATVEDGSYALAQPVYLYVNAASAEREDVQSFVEFALTNEAGVPAAAADQGYTIADDDIYHTGLLNVQTARTGRTFSRPATPVNVLTTDAGTVNIAGSSLLYPVTNAIVRDFSSQFTAATVNQAPLGNDAGWMALCSGELDVLQATAPASDEAFNLCKSNGIDTYAIDLGLEALVIAVAPGNDWAQCMTTDEVATLLSAGLPESASAAAPAGTEEPAADDTEAAPAATEDASATQEVASATAGQEVKGTPVTLWSEINSDWPEQPFLLVMPPLSTGETDYMIQTLTHDLTFVPRMDALTNADALYRAQGVANTDQDTENASSGITYLWWTALQGSEADVNLVAIDAGNGCVAPSPETFADGTYALSFPVSYYFSEKSFENPLVRALLWHFFDRSSLETLRKYPYAMSDYDAMATAQRDEVFNMLADYEASLATSMEATPAATEEAAPAGTEEPAATEAAPAMTEAAPAATEAPAMDATEAAPVATEAAPAETPAATEVATEEAGS